MALNASDVSAGDTILAAHQNAIIDDIEQHDHDGVDTSVLANLSVDTAQVANNAITGIKTTELLYDVHRQDDTSNSAVTDQTIRKGWGFIAGDGSGSQTESISFGITFGDVPIVIACPAGQKIGSDPTVLNELISSTSSVFAFPFLISTIGFQIKMCARNTEVLTAGTRFGYTWIAIGTKAK